MSEELKACICGTPAHIHEISMGDNWRTRYQIWCHDKACGFEGGIYNSTKKCVEEWNTRPIEDDLRVQLEFAKNDLAERLTELTELRAEIERLQKEMDAIVSLDELVVDKSQQIKVENERLRRIIVDAEWVTEEDGNYPFCARCGASFKKGHDNDCPYHQWEGGEK